MNKVYTYLFFLSLSLITYGQESSLKLIFAGDIMGHDSQIESARSGDSYNYDTCFSFIKPYLESADIAIANLEVTLAGPPFKGYPQFSSPDELAESAKNSGFDLFITANNHSLDRGKAGLERTISVLEEKDIIYTGTYVNELSRKKTYPLIIEKNGIRLAILNYTYGTNGLRVESPNVVNYIDKDIIREDLEKAELAKPDFTIVTLHWGLEYQRSQNREQEELAGFILENGADAIIGSHPHVIQPVNLYTSDSTEKVVVYSLGNFISNQRDRYRNGGIIFEMELIKENSTRLNSFQYLPVWVYKPESKYGGNHFVLLPSNKEKEFYDQIGMSEEDFGTMKIFNDDTVNHLEGLNFAQQKLAKK